jgi:hydrogenase expression/formation protein HypE
MSAEKVDGVVLLEHGSGGALSRQLLEDLLYPRVHNPDYPALTDATMIRTPGPGCFFTTDTYTVQPYIFPGGDIGKLAVYGTCNDLAVSGGRPRYLSVGMVLEEGLPLNDLAVLADSIRAASEETGVSVVTGDTKVVPRGKGGGIYINTGGIGEPAAPHPLGLHRIVPRDRVIVSGPVGTHGIALLAARENLDTGATLSSDAASLYPLCEKLYTLEGDLRFMRDATRGGIAAVCNEIVSGRRMGMDLEEEDFPILPEVRSLARILGLNPLEVANEGVLVAVVAETAEERALSLLGSLGLGERAACVGEITEENPGRVILTTPVGGRRILGFPRGLLLPRIC